MQTGPYTGGQTGCGFKSLRLNSTTEGWNLAKITPDNKLISLFRLISKPEIIELQYLLISLC